MTVTNNEPDKELTDRVAAEALKRLGWDKGEDDDDARLIRAAVPTVVDLTLDEVVSAMNEQTEKILGKEDPKVGYTYAMQDRVLGAGGNWVRVADNIAQGDNVAGAWSEDDRFVTQYAMGTLYVKSI